MNFIYTNKLSRWFFKKYFGIDKEVFKVGKDNIHYWVDKEKGLASCRVYQFKISDIPLIKNLKRLSVLALLLVKNPIGFVMMLTTDTSATNNKDSYIDASAPNTNYGSSDVIVVATYSSNPARVLIKFTLPSLSGSISLIKLYLLTGYVTNATQVNVHQLTQTGWTEAGVTWNKYDGTNNWTTAGGDYNSTIIHSLTPSMSSWVAFILQGTGSTHPLSLSFGDSIDLLLKLNSETPTTEIDFVSKEDTTPTNRPYLEITYSASSIKTVNGLSAANVKTINGLAIGNVKTYNGLG